MEYEMLPRENSNEFESEVEFLTKISTMTDFEDVKKTIDERIQQLKQIHDYAGEYSKMQVYITNYI